MSVTGTKFADRAVEALGDYINSNIAAQLRIVETDQSMTASSLTDPVEVVKARLPFDNRSPLLQVYDEGWQELAAPRNHVMVVDCTIVLGYVGDANLYNAERFCRRYMTAVRQTIMADATLGGNVAAAVITGGDSAAAIGDDSTTRIIYTMSVDVHVHSP